MPLFAGAVEVLNKCRISSCLSKSSGKGFILYNVEGQRSDSGAVAKRARYNSSLLDANLTRKGDAYDTLNETYVIFITENDVLRGGLPVYHINR